MSTAASPAEAKKKCSYLHRTGWKCPFDAEDGQDLCIFHLPADKKKPEDFWRHMASYLRALYESAGTEETTKFLAERGTAHWLVKGAREDLVAAYKAHAKEGQPWRFTGFVFPAMDEDLSFQNFVFAAAYFRDATFSAEAHFRGATFNGKADFRDATFSAEAHFRGATFNRKADFEGTEFSGRANFGSARFSGEASFRDARFSGEASFGCATFNGKAYFGSTEFSGRAYFGGAEFSGKAYFGGAEFSGRANFGSAKFSGEAGFRGATFSGKAYFRGAEFKGDANFSFVQFLQPPLFVEAEFKERVDFYEARLPGLSESDDERTARSIRLLAEKHGSYADAGDFYMIEMDFRRRRFRRTPGRWLQYILMELYRFSSRYGESPGRALVSFLAVLAGFGVLYSLAGFSIGNINVSRDLSFDLRQFFGTLLDFVRGMWLSLINLLPGNLRGETLGVKLPTTLGKLAAVFQVVFSYAMLTLFLLAIRRRFRR